MLTWQDNLSIGVLEVDIQHKLLFEKFNAFTAACEAQMEADGVYRLFWFLEAYAISHFTEEEKLMQRVAYPDFARHKEQHQNFAAQVATLKEQLRVEGPNPSLVSSIRLFVTSWLMEHISRMDRGIGHYVSAAGIPAI